MAGLLAGAVFPTLAGSDAEGDAQASHASSGAGEHHRLAPLPPDPGWEGAIGLIVHHGPAYPGSARMEAKVNPGGFLRWGRFTVTGAGGFTTRRNLEVERGIGAELLRRDGLRVRLSLRVDGGRAESASPELAGLGEIKATLRSRLSLRWEPLAGWVFHGAASHDLLDRVGGYLLDASVSREWSFGHGRRLGLSAGVNGAGDRYMQAWHGITPEQSLRSGYPVYRAGEGLREAYASATYRHEFGSDWSAFAQAHANRLLGPAAASPLTRRAGTQGVSAGLAWRF
ncbi:MAG: MipA/OmpV family protein [Rubrivivax sp.]